MKKLLVVLLALGLVMAFSMPASAFDSEFGGYWRTRAFIEKDFDGTDSGADDLQAVDTRTRLYYTAKFSDDFKFVNKFEFNTGWGDTGGGDIGADEIAIKVKNSYVDFNIAPVNAKIGIQGYTLARGFLFDDDFSGAVLTYKGDGISVPFMWAKAYEGGAGNDANDYDVDYYGIAPTISLDKITVNPLLLWVTSDEASLWPKMPIVVVAATPPAVSDVGEFDAYFLGVNVDADLDVASVWFTGIYEMGTLKESGGSGEIDIAAYLVALGASANVGPASVHGQFFYATGQDPDDDDWTAYTAPPGQSYYWSEIMGLGIFDSNNSANCCGDRISDLMAFQVGATLKPMDKVSVTLDLWNASLVEDDANGETSLGTEVDLIVTYALLENLKLDVVGAYLFAGEATTGGGADEADPYEVGTRLSFSF
jgi:hypothetical protein